MEKKVAVEPIQSNINTENIHKETEISVENRKDMELYIKLHIANHRPG